MSKTSTNPNRTIGMQRFCELRAMTGLSQKEFGEKYGISVRNIQNWENKNSIMSYMFKPLAFYIYYKTAETILGDEDLEALVRGWDNPACEGDYDVTCASPAGCSRQRAHWDGNKWSVDGVISWG